MPRQRPLGLDRVAVIAAHNVQVHAVRYALSRVGVNPDALTVSTANKIQGREYDFVFVWHPLSGRRDATAFHLEAGSGTQQVGSVRRRVRLLLIGLPFGFHSPDHREKTLTEWRDLLAA